MKLPSYFVDFLAAIEPSQSCLDDQQRGHSTLRSRLAGDDDFVKIHVNTFLQGSYRRRTAVYPGKDLDIVVVTSLNPDNTRSTDATARLRRCLERYYERVAPQNRSLCVTLDYVTMDVVIATSRQLLRENALSNLQMAGSIEMASGWKSQPLQIPDRELKTWVDTHPKRQIEWTNELNEVSGGYFVPLVKMFKWWRKQAYKSPEYPKGYVLERVVGELFDRTVRDHAEGFVQCLRALVARFEPYALARSVPHLADPGVPTSNVLHRLTPEDFGVFVDQAKRALQVAEAALAHTDIAESAALWRELFGDKFPSAPAGGKASFPSAPVRPPNRPAGFA